MNGFFKDGTARVGGKDIEFEQRGIRGGFLMYIPKSFIEDKSIVSNYSYLFSKDKSPLSIAIKHSPITALADKQKLTDRYFSHSPTVKLSETEVEDTGILYRETVTSSHYLSVYSLRFSVEIGNADMLFGCFNCAADYKDDWKPAVLQMLQNIERGRQLNAQ